MLDSEIDPSQNYLDRPQHPLDEFFNPKSVAIIGAKDAPKSVGRTLLSNMIASFKGKIFPVNPKYPSVLGLKSYPRIQDIPESVDLAVIMTPAKLVPELIDDCVAANVKSVIIISAGFKEIGEEGVALEKDVLARAKKGSIRIIGPNCLGIMNPHIGLNATFAANIALAGKMAFISQSGALCTAVLDWSLEEKIGFSAFVSIGSMSDVAWGDLIDYFDHDPHTHSILIYMETVGNARAFLSAAREVVFNKPIILIKPGRTAAAAKAAASHTGSLAGADDVFDAAIQRVGILRVETIGDLFNLAEAFAKQPHPKGSRLAIVTNAGGPAVLAADATLLNGAQLAELTPDSIDKLNQILPAAWSHNNPVDILGDAGPDRYAAATDIVMNDPNVDGILVILTPQDMTDSTETAKNLHAHPNKPILASWMGASYVAEGIRILNDSGIPSFSFPDSACKTFGLMWSQTDRLKLLYETPTLRDEHTEQDAPRDRLVAEFLASLKRENRTLLTEAESKAILSIYGIPVVETIVAQSPEEAATLAEKMGYPVVLKIHSLTITHKTDIGGVKLNLQDRKSVFNAYTEIQKNVGQEDFQGVTVQKMIAKSGYELILGSMVDPQFGPVLLFGSGGELVEIYKDRALGLPPLNTTLVKRLMQRTNIFKALQGVRGKKAVSLDKLEEVIIRFSRFIVEQPRVKECDINPLIASPEGIIALDARIVLHDFSIPNDALPKPAIRPYPIQYLSRSTLKNGISIILRPVRPEDEPLLVAFHNELSEETVRQRYFGFVSLQKRITHERLIRICHTDYDREILLIAETQEPREIIAASRINKIYGTSDGELKMVIIDRFQRQGLGRKLMEHSLVIASQEKFDRLHAQILKDNIGMLHLCEDFGFKLEKSSKNPAIINAIKVFSKDACQKP